MSPATGQAMADTDVNMTATEPGSVEVQFGADPGVLSTRWSNALHSDVFA